MCAARPRDRLLLGLVAPAGQLISVYWLMLAMMEVKDFSCLYNGYWGPIYRHLLYLSPFHSICKLLIYSWTYMWRESNFFYIFSDMFE